jgi:hypothetical protein
MAKRMPPFDIQDIPKAMRKLHMPTAAQLQESRFAVHENYSMSAIGSMDEIHQHGLSYPPSMINSTTIKMAWALSFARKKMVFERLVSDGQQSPGVVATLRRQLTPYKTVREVTGWNVAQSGFFEYHERFQFLRAAVNVT